MKRTAAVVVLAGVAALSGCGGGSSGSTQSQSQPPATPAPTQPPSTPPATIVAPTATVTATATAHKTVAPTVKPCTSAELTLRLGEGEGAAGTQYVPLVLTNSSTVTCTVHGYPGVSFVAGGGKQVGYSAAETGGTRKTVTLVPGGHAAAVLRMLDGAQDDGCSAVKAKGIRFYPPGETRSLYVADPVYVCTTAKGRTGIGVLKPGTNPQQ